MSVEQGRLYNVEGLDATGKSTLAKGLQEAFDGVMTYCPPDWMKPYRTFFNNSNADLRFLYYAVSNLWVDRTIVQPLLKQDGRYVFQDRTWLTTLAANEELGTSPRLLHLGLKVARTATRPAIAFIVQADNEVRRQRMMHRGVVTPDDLDSLNNQEVMEQNYVKWADRLRWNAVVFDNTHFTSAQACETLVRQISEKKP